MERAGSSQQRAQDTGWLITSVERMLRPMVRLLVGRMSCNVVVDLIKQIYVQEAKRRLLTEDPERRVTKSALALMTGLDTRMITALEGATHEYSFTDLSPESAVLEIWANDKTYLELETGEPRILPIYGRGLSFQTLVTRTIGRNVTCPTVLDRLVESGNVEVVDDNFVALKERYFAPIKESERTALDAGSFAVNRLASTIEHNMASQSAGSDKWLQQDRWSRKIPLDRLPAFRRELRVLLDRHIVETEQVMEPHEEPVSNESHYQAGVGWYYWEQSPK